MTFPAGSYTAFYGLLTLATGYLAVVGNARGMVGAWLVLLAAWVLSALSFHILQASHPAVYPIIDFALGSILVLQARRIQEPRLFSLALLFLADFIIHIQYALSPDHAFAVRWYYDLKLNLIYVLQLGYVAGISAINMRGGTKRGGLG